MENCIFLINPDYAAKFPRKTIFPDKPVVTVFKEDFEEEVPELIQNKPDYTRISE